MVRIAGILLGALALISIAAAQPTYNLRFALVNNDGKHYDVRIQMNGSASFANGGANITFNYNTACLGKPALLAAHAFSGGAYSPVNISQPLPGCVSVNIEYEGNAGEGSPIAPAPAWTDIATIRFSVMNPNTGSELLFRQAGTLQSPTVQYLDDLQTVLRPGETAGLNIRPMPMEVLLFSGRVAGSTVILDWRTGKQSSVSDFIVERTDPADREWSELGAVPSAASSSLEHKYSFVDDKPLTTPTSLYRLKQTDAGGSTSYSNILEVGLNAPSGFDLKQNYPNPASLMTSIPFVIPVDAHVEFTILDTNGKEIRQVAAQALPAGLHTLNIPLADLASGVYQYRLTAGNTILTKRMTVTR